MIRYLVKLCITILGGLPLYLLARRPWKRRSGREWGLGAFVLFMCALLILTLEGEHAALAWYISGQRTAESGLWRCILWLCRCLLSPASCLLAGMWMWMI